MVDVARRPPDTRRRIGAGRDARKLAALVLLAATQFLLAVDGSIVNVALPSIGRDLGVAPEGLSWVVNAYLLAFGGFLLLGGRVADHLGRRRTYMAGLVLFTAASLAGALAPSGLWLAVARGAQGLGAALVAPAALALVLTLFGEGAERNRALGVWAALGGSGGAAGAILGGLLTDGFGWEAVLLVNLPIGVAAVALAPGLLPAAPAEPGTHRFDLAGAVSVTAGLALLVYALVGANDAGWWSARTLLLGGIAVLLLAAFTGIEAGSPHPLVPPRVFRNRPLGNAYLVTMLTTGAIFPMFVFLTLYTQDVLGYRPIQAGLAQLPLVATIAVSATMAPRLLPRLGTRATLVAGLLVVAGGLWWLAAIPPDGGFLGDLLGPSLVVGAGAGVTWVASMVAATSGADRDGAGLASGLVTTAQQLGGALGIAALVAVAAAGTTGALGDGVERLVALTEGFQAGLLAAALVAAAAAALAAGSPAAATPAAVVGEAGHAQQGPPGQQGRVGGGHQPGRRSRGAAGDRELLAPPGHARDREHGQHHGRQPGGQDRGHRRHPAAAEDGDPAGDDLAPGTDEPERQQGEPHGEQRQAGDVQRPPARDVQSP
jgi:EmrB/QacA subfamily drug resistance transporter